MNRTSQLLLAALVTLNVCSLFLYATPLISFLVIALLIWNALHLFKGVRLPHRWEMILIGITGSIITLFNHKSLLGPEAATDLLMCFAGLKLLETKQYRDTMITVFMCLFLLTAHLLNSQGLATLMFFIFDLIFITHILLRLHPGKSALLSFKEVAKVLAIALPLWIALFTFFPRFGVGISFRPQTISVSGFSGELNPGEVRKLVLSDELAFRAQFNTTAITSKDLYWRGIILPVTEGLRWTRGRINLLPAETFSTAATAPTSTEIGYQIWLEPTFGRRLFSLDYPTSANNEQWKAPGNKLQSLPGLVRIFEREIISRANYSGVAQKQMPSQRLSEVERKAFLQLPPNLEPAISDLAQKLRAQTSEKSIDNLVQWFKTQEFRYTLEPDENPKRSLGQFLFESKKGFCEHFAAASAVLLRTMGVPARVVLGFQGGEYNDLGNYWIIKNKNAHAWTEAWVQDQQEGKWVRLDLVSTVAPVRLEIGANFFIFGANATAGNLTGEGTHRQANESLPSYAQRKAQLYWDAVEMQWSRFLLYYDFELQQSLLAQLGIQNVSRTALFTGVGLFLLFLSFIIAWRLQRSTRNKDPLTLSWAKFLKKMTVLGIQKNESEGPQDFISRASAHLPSLSSRIESLGVLYLNLKYGPTDPQLVPKQLKQLRKILKSIN